jgi:hypothetical protein
MDDGFYCCDFFDFNDSNEGVFFVGSEFKNIKIEQKLEYRICSFSAEKALKSQLMWGHYASAGMGVTIEVDVTKNHPDFYRVKYDGKTSESEGIKNILTNKSREWRHEREWRYLSKESRRYLKHPIEKVYFGTPYVNLANYDAIKHKHRKLQSYLEYSESLKNKLDEKSILYCMFKF